MPSPIGHALAGLAIHGLTARDGAELEDRPRAALLVAAGTAPDADLLLRFVDGQSHHQKESHGVGSALLAALAFGLVARALRRPRPLALGLAAGWAWLGHIVLDYLNRDTHPPIGVMALWPFSRDYYKFPWPLFLDVGRSLEWETLRNNALAAAWEATLLLPILLAVWRRRQRRGA
jgi:membrane-bound metal-dependent hydrolase YbcI (DUF457 family)